MAFLQVLLNTHAYQALDKIYGKAAGVFCGFYATYFLDRFFEFSDNKQLKQDLNDRDKFHLFLQKALQKFGEETKFEVKNLKLEDQELVKILNVINRPINQISSDVLLTCAIDIDNDFKTKKIIHCLNNQLEKDYLDVFASQFFQSWNPEEKLGVIVNLGVERDGFSGHWLTIMFRIDETGKIFLDIADSLGVNRVKDNKLDTAILVVCEWFTDQVKKHKAFLINDPLRFNLNRLKRKLINLRTQVHNLSQNLQNVTDKLTELKTKLTLLQSGLT